MVMADASQAIARNASVLVPISGNDTPLGEERVTGATMTQSIATTMREHAADGRYGKADLYADACKLLDGRGITRAELKAFKKTFKELKRDKNVRITSVVDAAYDHLVDRMRPFDKSRDVHAPDLTKGEIKSLLSFFVEQAYARRGQAASSSSGASQEPSRGDGPPPGNNRGGYGRPSYDDGEPGPGNSRGGGGWPSYDSGGAGVGNNRGGFDNNGCR